MILACGCEPSTPSTWSPRGEPMRFCRVHGWLPLASAPIEQRMQQQAQPPTIGPDHFPEASPSAPPPPPSPAALRASGREMSGIAASARRSREKLEAAGSVTDEIKGEVVALGLAFGLEVLEVAGPVLVRLAAGWITSKFGGDK